MKNIFNFIDVADTFIKTFPSTYASEIDEDVLAKLNEFADLEDGWSYGEGKPIDADVIEKAKTLFKIGNYFLSDADVFPGTNGQILLVFYVDERCIEFTINEDLSVDVAVEHGIGYDFEVTYEKRNISLREAERVINKFNMTEWKSSDLFITNTMIADVKDFEAQPFQTPQITEEYPSLIWDVLPLKTDKGKQFVITS
ncbi:hypothetical protein [Rhodohalobacter sp.]|uniref:hypothetical protein n=1 Tax=Rhodohalobacter sp. TaxID=1974210 RepID=UPI003567275D